MQRWSDFFFHSDEDISTSKFKKGLKIDSSCLLRTEWKCFCSECFGYAFLLHYWNSRRCAKYQHQFLLVLVLNVNTPFSADVCDNTGFIHRDNCCIVNFHLFAWEKESRWFWRCPRCFCFELNFYITHASMRSRKLARYWSEIALVLPLSTQLYRFMAKRCSLLDADRFLMNRGCSWSRDFIIKTAFAGSGSGFTSGHLAYDLRWGEGKFFPQSILQTVQCITEIHFIFIFQT